MRKAFEASDTCGRYGTFPQLGTRQPREATSVSQLAWHDSQLAWQSPNWHGDNCLDWHDTRPIAQIKVERPSLEPLRRSGACLSHARGAHSTTDVVKQTGSTICQTTPPPLLMTQSSANIQPTRGG